MQAGKTLLESYLRNPQTGLCELIWNAFDEDARRVTVSLDTNVLGGIDQILVADDGRGMSKERALRGFSNVGDSWKLPVGSLTEGKRPVHGRHGRGRYAAFSLGELVRWDSIAVAVTGDQQKTVVRGTRGDLQGFDVSSSRAAKDGTLGTVVTVSNITDEARAALDDIVALRRGVLTQFALHLQRYRDFTVEIAGERLDPHGVIDKTQELPLTLPEGIAGPATLTVIEWKLTDVDRRLYLCSSSGSIIDERKPGVQAPGAEFTAYLTWAGFDRAGPPVFEDDNETEGGKVLTAAREALRDYLLTSSRQREAATVKRWRSEGVYPYKQEPRTRAERATRDAFNVVAMAASRTVDEAKSSKLKAMSLSLLKDALEKDPESLIPILKDVTNLPKARLDELRQLLTRTSLAHIIQSARSVGDRIDFLKGLDSIVFDRGTKKRLLERRQLHRMLAQETWVFGEQWALMGDDERLTEVLKKHLQQLGKDVDLANLSPVLREDGSDAIPDLVLGRKARTKADRYEHLVVELKRPKHKLTDADISQIRSYASAVANDERFDQPNATWEFVLVGNETTRLVEESRHQPAYPPGVVQRNDKYTLVVKTWAEIVADAEQRLKFVQDSLEYQSARDQGLGYLREHYAQYLPD